MFDSGVKLYRESKGERKKSGMQCQEKRRIYNVFVYSSRISGIARRCYRLLRHQTSTLAFVQFQI